MSSIKFPELGPVTDRQYLIHIGVLADEASKASLKNEIKTAIDRAGTSQAAIAEYLKITPTCVGRVIAGTMRSKRVEDELEKLIGKKIFGESKESGRPKTTYKGEAQQVAA